MLKLHEVRDNIEIRVDWPECCQHLSRYSSEMNGWRAAQKEKMRRHVYKLEGKMIDITDNDYDRSPTIYLSDSVKGTVFTAYFTVEKLIDYAEGSSNWEGGILGKRGEF